MTRPTSTRFVVTFLLIALATMANGFDSDGLMGTLKQIDESEFSAEMQQLALKIGQLEINEASGDAARIKLLMLAAQEEGDAQKLELLKIDLKQAELRIEMRRLQTEMTRLEIVQQRARAQRLRSKVASAGREKVEVEHLKELGVVVIRGSNLDIDKIKAAAGAEVSVLKKPN